MNILIIDNSLSFTGAFKCALNEAELLSDRHRFVFVLNEKSSLRKGLEEKGYKVYNLPMVEIRRSIPVLLIYPLMLVRNAIELLRILKHENVQLIQVNDYYNLLGAMAKKIGYKGRLNTYVRFLPSVMPGILNKLWIKWGLKYSNYMIPVSDAVLKQLPAHNKIRRIYDPVLLSEKLPPKEYVTKDVINMLYLSNYIMGKGQDAALEAFAVAYNRNKNIRLKFMGSDMGLEKNAAFRQRLTDRAEELGLSEVVEFLPFNADVEKVIKEADVMLNFSEAESFSMTCLEAAYYGTPLIATRCGGPEEIVADGRTGITVPVKDVQAMADAIITMAGDEYLRKSYALAGKDHVRNKFSIEHYKQAIKQVLSES